MGRRRLVLILIGLAIAIPAVAIAAGEVGTEDGVTGNGRQLDPVGRLTTVGTFPTGGAISPDGRFYWAVDAGRGVNAVRVVDVETGEVKQTLPIPGGYIGVAFAPDGKRAYVSGQPAEGPQPPEAVGLDGDVIHVYDVNPANGAAQEVAPIVLPEEARDGAAAADELPPANNVNSWPEGLDVTPDGKHLVVALGQADQAAIVNLATGTTTLSNVGRYPYGVAIDPTRPRAYISNERDGTVSVISIPDGALISTISLGAPSGFAGYPHAEGLAVDPKRDRLYVALTDRDVISVVNTETLEFERIIEVGRPEAAIGSAPVSVSVAPDGQTLYAANAGEDAVIAVALTRRPELSELKPRGPFLTARPIRSIGKYRKLLLKAQRVRNRQLQTGSKAQKQKARKAYKRKAAKLRRNLLFGTRQISCGGASTKQDRAYGKSVLRSIEKRQRQIKNAKRIKNKKKRAKAISAAKRRYKRSVQATRKRYPEIVECLAPGAIPGTPAFSTIGRFPTAAYTSDVDISPSGGRLVWLAAKGFGTGPNPQEQSIKELLKGRVGVLNRPTDQEMAAFTPRADAAIRPVNLTAPPPGTPVVGPGGGPSEKIKYVFYVVRENRTYDQIFGSDPRGDGEPSLQLFDDNGVAGPTGGATPNAHALSREFSLLDHVFANSEESTAGHKITAGGYANDYIQRYTFTNRGRKGNPDIYPIGNPPNAYIFDQAVREAVPFRIYGEFGAGNQPFANEGRPTYPQVQASTDSIFPSQIQGTCRGAIPAPPGAPLSARCTADAAPSVGATAGRPSTQSRMGAFATQFQAQLAAGTVPAFNYLILFNDHTDGTSPGVYSPKANIADNDLALGQLVELVSQSSIWDESAIFVVEDDSQDGADHLDAHRMPAFVISPWAKSGGQVISSRFDHYSFLRTIGLVLGLQPLSINDALATPLYDAFISGSAQPDVEGTRYEAIQPEASMVEVNPPNAPDAALSLAMPYDQTDVVPQRISDRILWRSIFGADADPPSPGPNASPIESARANGAINRYRNGGNPRRFLIEGGEGEDEQRLEVTATLLAAAQGITVEEALKLLGENESEEEEEEEGEESEEEEEGED